MKKSCWNGTIGVRLLLKLVVLGGFLWLMPFPDCRGADIDVPSLIAQAVSDGKSSVRIPPGAYRVSKAIRLEKVNGFTINGTGAILVFTNLHDGGIRMMECSDITLKGVTIDFDPLPFTQGTITAIADDRRSVEVDMHQGYADLAWLYQDVYYPHLFDPKTRLQKSGCLFRELTKQAESIGGRKYRIPLFQPQNPEVQVGDLVCFYNRGLAGAVFMKLCGNITLDRLTIFAGCWAINCHDGKGGIRVSRVAVTRGPRPDNATEDRLRSTVQDAFFFARGRGGPILEDCYFGFMGDDHFNIHGYCYPIARVESPTSFLAATMAPAFMTVQKGDRVRILDTDSFSIVDSATISRIEPNVVVEGELLPTEEAQKFWKYAAPDPVTKKVNMAVYRVTLDQPCNSLKKGRSFDVPGGEGNCGFIIRNCRFHDNSGLGRIQASDGIIEKNRFERTAYEAISIQTGYAYDTESGWAENIIIRNNKFIDLPRFPQYSAGSYHPAALSIAPSGEGFGLVQGHRHIVIEKNVFDGCHAVPISVGSAQDVDIRKNRFTRIDLPEDKSKEPGDSRFIKIDHSSCTDIRVSNRPKLLQRSIE
jgi:hypothetical protein